MNVRELFRTFRAIRWFPRIERVVAAILVNEKTVALVDALVRPLQRVRQRNPAASRLAGRCWALIDAGICAKYADAG
jgi:hypothetical protein